MLNFCAKLIYLVYFVMKKNKVTIFQSQVILDPGRVRIAELRIQLFHGLVLYVQIHHLGNIWRSLLIQKEAKPTLNNDVKCLFPFGAGKTSDSCVPSGELLFFYLNLIIVSLKYIPWR